MGLLEPIGRRCVVSTCMYLRQERISCLFMSSYCICNDGYQAVLSCENTLFSQGVYCPLPAHNPPKADSAQQQKYVPLQLVNGLNCLSSRVDIGSSFPVTSKNQVIIFSRKLGHTPLETRWNIRKCVSCLDFLRLAAPAVRWGGFGTCLQSKATRPTTLLQAVWHTLYWLHLVGPAQRASHPQCFSRIYSSSHSDTHMDCSDKLPYWNDQVITTRFPNLAASLRTRTSRARVSPSTNQSEPRCLPIPLLHY
jgi:hypothetical protein